MHPYSQVVRPTSNVTFSVLADGVGPLSYQWMFNGAAIPKENFKTLSLPKVTSAAIGGYSVVVGNQLGSATSRIAQLTVLTPPAIVAQPRSRTNLLGTAATFTVQITNTATLPLTYRWKKGTRFIQTNVLNEFTSTLILRDVKQADAASYSVVVTNFGSSQILSRTATLSVVTTTEKPTVSWLSPSDDSHFASESDVPFFVTAADPDQGIDRVEFYAEDVYLGVASSGPPYAFKWSGAPPGAYLLTARAYDLVEASTTSLPVRIVITAPENPPIRISEFSHFGDSVRIEFSVGSGQAYRLESSQSIVGPWEPTGETGVGDGTLRKITRPLIPTLSQFFRINAF